MATYIVVGVVFGISAWMIISALVNKAKISKTEFILTTGAGVVASSLVILSRLI